MNTLQNNPGATTGGLYLFSMAMKEGEGQSSNCFSLGCSHGLPSGEFVMIKSLGIS